MVLNGYCSLGRAEEVDDAVKQGDSMGDMSEGL